jgi:hypothetical protein
MRITRKPQWWLASIMRKGKEKLSIRRSLMKPRARRTKAREKRFLSLSLQVIEAIRRSVITRDKRRHSVLTLLSLRKRTSQSRRSIIGKKPLKAYRPRYRRNAERRHPASNAENLTIGGGSAMVRSWPCLAGKLLPFGRRNERRIPLTTRVLLHCLLLRRQK